MTRRIGTKVVSGARSLPPGGGVPVVPPLVQSVAFDYASLAEQDAVFGGEQDGYVYGRYGTPTTAALEVLLAELDELPRAVCFASGMSAVHALLTQHRGPLVIQEDCYGGSRAVAERLRAEDGREVRFVAATDVSAIEAAVAPGALVLVEAISNPLLHVVDVAAVAGATHAAGGSLAVDATFATPVLLRPAPHGADIVLHSLTKYLNGHGDVMGGSIAGGEELCAGLADRVQLDGAYLAPHEAWLCIRGLRTLELRVRRQCESALLIATHLAAHPRVGSVRYPGLAGHPQHDLATRQLGGLYGGVIGVTLRRDERAAAIRFLDALELAASATTIGDLFTEVLYPPVSSHRRLDPAERARLGMTEGFVRISVGIEDPADIIEDLDNALEQV